MHWKVFIDVLKQRLGLTMSNTGAGASSESSNRVSARSFRGDQSHHSVGVCRR